MVNKIELPCVYYPRLEDNFINQVIKQGLILSVKLTDDKNLKTRLRKLISIFDEEISDIILDLYTIKQLKKVSNRLTNAYIPSITIIKLLINFEGINLDEEYNNINIKLNGFLFDMNHFFQSLLLRVLTDNLEQYTVKSEYKVNSFYDYDDLYNPKNRKTPTLRPDYMIFSDKNIISILDAKYINLWEKTLDSKVLYQLTVYSLLYKNINSAIILYPSIGKKKEQRINLNDFTMNGKKSQILIRYVDMEYLTKLISNRSYQNKKMLIEYVNELVFY